MVKKLILWPVYSLLVILVAYLVWASVAYGDLSTTELKSLYGDDQLQLIDVNGAPVYYRRTQNSNGPDVVLIHSHYYDMGMWDEWTTLLADTHNVLRYDLSSHGFSGPHLSDDYSMTADVATLTGLLNALGIEQAHIVGSSLGGNIAFNFAAQNPKQTLSLALINSGGIQQQAKAGREGEIPGWMNTVLRLLPTMAFQQFVDWMIIDDRVNTKAVAVRMHAMFRHKGNRQAELSRMNQFRYQNNANILQNVSAPVLIQWGNDNPQLPASNAAEFEKMLVSAHSVRHTLFENAGHVLPLEQPKESVADYVNFLGQPGIEP